MATFPTSPSSGGVSLPVSIANGGTGSTTAPDARTALGVIQGTLGAIYGGGADGAFDLDGTNTYASQFTKVGSTYTQIADVRATTFRVRSGVIVLPSQFWLYAETSFTVDAGGIVRNDGNAATGATAGAQVVAANTIQTNGQVGGVGRTASNTGAAGSATTNTIGGGGGAGGTGGGANAGGAGGTASAIAVTTQGLGTQVFRTTHRTLAGITLTVAGGGCGGGSGGFTLNLGTGSSGGGGGGASAIRVNARTFSNAGTVSCNGGNGGNGIVLTLDAVCGGGGGGGGGFIGILTDTYTNTGTIQCLGGTGGTGAGTGAGAGVAGSAGRISIMTPTGTTNL